MAKFLAYIMAMKKVNIGNLKDNLSKFIGLVEQGEASIISKVAGDLLTGDESEIYVSVISTAELACAVERR